MDHIMMNFEAYFEPCKSGTRRRMEKFKRRKSKTPRSFSKHYKYAKENKNKFGPCSGP